MGTSSQDMGLGVVGDLLPSPPMSTVQPAGVFKLDLTTTACIGRLSLLQVTTSHILLITCLSCIRGKEKTRPPAPQTCSRSSGLAGRFGASRVMRGRTLPMRPEG